MALSKLLKSHTIKVLRLRVEFRLASEDDFTPAPAWGVGRSPLRAFARQFPQVEPQILKARLSSVLEQGNAGP